MGIKKYIWIDIDKKGVVCIDYILGMCSVFFL